MLQCKEKMRPVKRALKMLESPEENMNESDQVAQTRQVYDGNITADGCVPIQRRC